MKNILLCGVGGQGTVLASKLIAQAAMEKGMKAKSAETIGMAQRCGSVVSHVRFGQEIYSPLIPMGQADVIMAFEPGEAMRAIPYLKEGGSMIVCPDAILPVTASLGIGGYSGIKAVEYLKEHVKSLVLVDGTSICKECGSPKVLNVALLGAAAAGGMLGITIEEMENAVMNRVPDKLKDMNRKALQLGAASVSNMKR